MKLNLRDLFWLVLVVALITVWGLAERKHRHSQAAAGAEIAKRDQMIAVQSVEIQRLQIEKHELQVAQQREAIRTLTKDIELQKLRESVKTDPDGQ